MWNDERTEPRSASQFQPPSASCSLEQAIDETVAALAEVGAECDDAAVDARFDLAFEERRISELGSPRDVLANEIDRRSRARARRVEAEVAQQQQRVHVRPPERRGDAVAPLAVGPLLIEQPRAPSFRRDARPLGRDDLRGRLGEIAHDLPADRRVGVEEPVDDGVGVG